MKSLNTESLAKIKEVKDLLIRTKVILVIIISRVNRNKDKENFINIIILDMELEDEFEKWALI